MKKLTKRAHLALLKQAIAANLQARSELEDRNEPGGGVLKFINAATLMGTPCEQLKLECIIEDATRAALKKQMRDLGKEPLHKLLNCKDRMLKVAEETANLDPPNWQFRINIIDKNWDGIGGWVA